MVELSFTDVCSCDFCCGAEQEQARAKTRAWLPAGMGRDWTRLAAWSMDDSCRRRGIEDTGELQRASQHSREHGLGTALATPAAPATYDVCVNIRPLQQPSPDIVKKIYVHISALVWNLLYSSSAFSQNQRPAADVHQSAPNVDWPNPRHATEKWQPAPSPLHTTTAHSWVILRILLVLNLYRYHSLLRNPQPYSSLY
jgi:hypothetical protein